MKDESGNQETDAHFRKADNPERDELADDELVALDRGDVDLVDSADLTLPHHIHTGEKEADKGNQNDEDARHHVVSILQFGIVPA